MSLRFLPTQLSRRHLVWLLVGLVILFAVVVRVRLRAMPLERDEGEYAYAGQLMLQGIPPYKFAYNMKLPGTYAAYAMILAVFGQSASAIHLGLAIVNAVSIGLMFLVARKLLDDAGAITAASVFALMSLSPSVLGLAAHATHFVVLCALAAILLLLQFCGPVNDSAAGEAPAAGEDSQRVRGNRFQLFLSGLFFGLAILMKQHGILFAIFGGVYLIWHRLHQGLNAKPRKSDGRRSRSDSHRRKQSIILGAKDLGVLALGGAAPYFLMCLILASAGVFHEFWFWTFTYARKYVSSVPMAEGPAYLRKTMGGIFADNPYFWISLGLGGIVMWWDEKLSVSARFFVTIFALCSVVAVSAGFYFREHYFIMLLPALGLVNGVAVSRSLRLLRHDKTIELFLTVPILLLFLIGVGACFVAFGPLWFSMAPTQASTRIYGSTLFSEAWKAAEVIKAHATSDARIAVIGSEPEIYFYAHRRSVTGFIYMYPLMETHDYALKMQEEMIRDIETGKPEFVVFVKENFSWLVKAGSEKKIFAWWDAYWIGHYDLEQSLNVSDDVSGGSDTVAEGAESSRKGSSFLLVLKRK